MCDGYVGEIRMFAGNWAPSNWALCDGRLLRIQDYQALYSLIGTTYGGDGVNNFALPDLRGRIPVHRSGEYPVGAKFGSETVQLTPNHLPAHVHTAQASNLTADSTSPNGKVWTVTPINEYAAVAPNATMHADALTTKGNSAAHDNMMPYLAINFIICIEGVYPNFQ